MARLMSDKDNRWHGTGQQAPEKWTSAEWRKFYGFPRQGKGMASRTDRLIDGKFSARVKPKVEFAVSECKDGRAR